jgi:outer membrane protein with beta-barrel domain
VIINRVKSYGILLPLVFLIFTSNISLKSQDYNLRKGLITTGFEAGFQFTGIDDPDVAISEGGIGYSIGPYIEYQITNDVKLRGGIELDHRAFSIEDLGHLVDDSLIRYTNSYYNNNEDYKVNYLTIPLSIIYIVGSEKFNFYLQGTFYYSLLLNSEMSGVTDIFVAESDAPYVFFDGYPELSVPGHHYVETKPSTFNTNDIGINISIGGIYYVKPKLGLSLSPGISYSFSNVWEDPLRRTTWTRLYKVTAGIVYIIN